MSSDKFVMSVRQAAELDHAFERNGFTPADVKRLSTGNFLHDVREVLGGNAEIRQIEHITHIIDGDNDLFIPTGWRVQEHKKSGFIKLKRIGNDLYANGKKVTLFLSRQQQSGRVVAGPVLLKELLGKKVLNANVLDALLRHPEIIPESWKKDEDGYNRCVIFCGTIYYSSSPLGLCMRYLYWNNESWDWSYWILSGDLSASNPVALFG